MRHVFKNKAELKEFLENKYEKQIAEIKATHKRELQSQEVTLNEIRKADLARQKHLHNDELNEIRAEHRSELQKKESEWKQKYKTLQSEKESEIRVESNRVQKEIDRLSRKNNKQDQMNKELETKLTFINQVFIKARTMQDAIRSEQIEKKHTEANFLRIVDDLEQLENSLVDGKIPHVTYTKQESIEV